MVLASGQTVSERASAGLHRSHCQPAKWVRTDRGEAKTEGTGGTGQWFLNFSRQGPSKLTQTSFPIHKIMSGVSHLIWMFP